MIGCSIVASPISTVLIDERHPPLYGSLYAFRLYIAKILQSPVWSPYHACSSAHAILPTPALPLHAWESIAAANFNMHGLVIVRSGSQVQSLYQTQGDITNAAVTGLHYCMHGMYCA